MNKLLQSSQYFGLIYITKFFSTTLTKISLALVLLLVFCYREHNSNFYQNPDLIEEHQFYLSLVLKVNSLKGDGEAMLEFGSVEERQSRI